MIRIDFAERMVRKSTRYDELDRIVDTRLRRIMWGTYDSCCLIQRDIDLLVASLLYGYDSN